MISSIATPTATALGAIALKNTCTSQGWIYFGGGTTVSVTRGTLLSGHLENYVGSPLPPSWWTA